MIITVYDVKNRCAFLGRKQQWSRTIHVFMSLTECLFKPPHAIGRIWNSNRKLGLWLAVECSWKNNCLLDDIRSYTGHHMHINIIAIGKAGPLQMLYLVYLSFKPIIEMKFVRFIMKNAALANVPHHIEHFSKFSPSPLSMKQFLDFGECFFCCVICSYMKSFVSLNW